VTATAATNGKQRRPATAHNARTIHASWGYVRPEKRKVEAHPEGQVVSAVSDWGGRDRPPIADPQKGTITMTPEYGDEKLTGQQSERVSEQSEGILPQDREDSPESVMEERDLEDREQAYLNPEDNEAHAPGRVCARCGAVITARQDARLGADNRWVHEECP
jgi:hypothetical protein